MLSKIKGVKYLPEYTYPRYKVKLESPEGKYLIILFDYTQTSPMKSYKPLKVYYDGEFKEAKLSWYTQEVEKMTVSEFLSIIADKIDKKYNVNSQG
ncbi:hypothetical protein [Heyndrickxia acidicola]|uniref:Uncharacterized protein n=1 Tax=Heyndrickxia acidicola TaxID=209389 RepID=A0ABU6MN93_9BACI|nr:hypothetical protein [Heyndrickxia acidicola]MED1205867.1 hypothetical protein [Heyndrickxia acidicola]